MSPSVFRRPLYLLGLCMFVTLLLAALFAPWIAPFPEHAGSFVDFANASKPPDARNWFGTDVSGRDLFSRMLFAYRVSLSISFMVLMIAVPIGLSVGLVAGYLGGWFETVLMRVVDAFLSIPPLALALAIMGFLEPNLRNAMLAITSMWWPWYARLSFTLARSLRNEPYIAAARVIGASRFHIILREILPNCVPSVLTKVTLDCGFVMLVAASLGFLGFGVQAPTPELGSMVSEGAQYLPSLWWMALGPGVAIAFAVLAFNLLGDGLREAFEVD